jgi:hypothetical protein
LQIVHNSGIKDGFWRVMANASPKIADGRVQESHVHTVSRAYGLP